MYDKDDQGEHLGFRILYFFSRKEANHEVMGCDSK